MYLITNSDNTTWRNIQCGENITHSESNPNYQFTAYSNPSVALFMYPAYEGNVPNPSLWEGAGENITRNDKIRIKYEKFTTLKKLEVKLPTEEQSMIFGFINALAVTNHKVFNEWAIKYLTREDTTLESAHKMLDYMYEESCAAAYPLVAAIEKNDFRQYAAFSSYRAFNDSLEQNDPVDLAKAAQVALTMPLEDILKILQ